MPTNEQIAIAFTALSHKRRVLIFRILMRDGRLTHGALQARAGFSAMTLTHHLGPMVAAGLVTRQIRGAYTYMSLKPGPWRDLIHAIAPKQALGVSSISRRGQFPDHEITVR